jgi:glutaredoxin
LAFLACGCHSALKLTPKQNEDLHLACQKRLAGKDAPPDRSTIVGFLPERGAKGTPVTIYGASWCDACHVAADYMRQYGIPFIEVDVEQDAETQAKLEALVLRAGLGKVKGLPVLDVRGTIAVGFNPCVLEAAWAAP